MTTVGTLAKVTEPVLYQHCSNKLDLYLAVVQQSLDDLSTALSEVLVTTTSSRGNDDPMVLVRVAQPDRLRFPAFTHRSNP